MLASASIRIFRGQVCREENVSLLADTTSLFGALSLWPAGAFGTVRVI